MNFPQVIDLYGDGSNLKKVAQTASEFLRKGNVLVYPTDTIYGLGADAGADGAVFKIREIKEREKEKPFSVIVRDLAMAEKYVFLTNYARAVFKKFLPGKFTLILPSRGKLSAGVEGINGKLAIRIPDHSFTKAVSGIFRRPFVTTSVNLAGQPPMNWGSEIAQYFEDKLVIPDLIIDAGRIGSAENPPKPSTVIDLSQEKACIMRPGSLTSREMLKLLCELEQLKKELGNNDQVKNKK